MRRGRSPANWAIHIANVYSCSVPHGSRNFAATLPTLWRAHVPCERSATNKASEPSGDGLGFSADLFWPGSVRRQGQLNGLRPASPSSGARGAKWASRIGSLFWPKPTAKREKSKEHFILSEMHLLRSRRPASVCGKRRRNA